MLPSTAPAACSCSLPLRSPCAPHQRVPAAGHSDPTARAHHGLNPWPGITPAPVLPERVHSPEIRTESVHPQCYHPWALANELLALRCASDGFLSSPEGKQDFPGAQLGAGLSPTEAAVTAESPAPCFGGSEMLSGEIFLNAEVVAGLQSCQRCSGCKPRELLCIK